jgi:sensor histidine kinase YesM
MHPILSRTGRLDLYLAAWIPAAGLLTAALALPGHRSWQEAAMLSVPLTVIAAFMSLALWPLCRAMPMNTALGWSFIATHAVAILASVGVWGLIGALWATSIGHYAPFLGAYARYRADVPTLLVLGALLFVLAIMLHYLTIAFDNARQAERSALEAQVQAREAEVRALRAQINPHFLFNCLNAVASLAGSDPARARSMCIMLSDFLRRGLALGASDDVALSEELDLSQRYLAIEQVRFADRLTVEHEIDPEAVRCRVPTLILQPLVENAITHGIAHSLEGGTVRITARRTGTRIDIAVENPADRDRPKSRGQGMGIANVRSRLASRHPAATRVECREENGRFRVEISMPAVDPESSAPATAVVAPDEVRSRRRDVSAASA